MKKSLFACHSTNTATMKTYCISVGWNVDVHERGTHRRTGAGRGDGRRFFIRRDHDRNLERRADGRIQRRRILWSGALGEPDQHHRQRRSRGHARHDRRHRRTPARRQVRTRLCQCRTIQSRHARHQHQEHLRRHHPRLTSPPSPAENSPTALPPPPCSSRLIS